uniref:Uncharacterized protein n=1 Tax=Acrobeloides nanus TaxID=290746 RepID=A0A914CD21_9BILA
MNLSRMLKIMFMNIISTIHLSIVDKTKELNSEAIDDKTSSIYNSLSWVYLRPGVHTVSIDATRNLILRSPANSRCDDPDIISSYNDIPCNRTCATIKNKTEWDCILPIKTSSKVDNKSKMCMEMPNDIDKYHDECVEKCEEYCDFW